MKIHFSIAILLILSACSGNSKKALFEKLNATDIGIDFTNDIIESDSVNVVSFTNIYNGGGVGVADFNRDNKPDLFFTGNMVSCRLYINQTENHKIRFQDVTKESKIYTNRWCTGVSIADVNNDQWPDIYVCVSGNKDSIKRRNYLFIHQGLDSEGIPFFEEMADSYGLADQTYSTQASFIDYDKDNDLDLFVAVNFADQFYGSSVNIPVPSTKNYSERSDRLYKNIGIGEDGHPVFIDASLEAGILHEGYTLGVVVYDINKDGWPDIYQANDFLSNDIIYINQGDGTFINKIGDYFKHTTFAGMGMDISDFNNDSQPDIFVLDMTPKDNQRQKAMLLPTRTSRFMTNIQAGYFQQYNRNTLQLNNGNSPNGDLSFSEIGQLANIHHTDWSWTILLGDLNNSGYKDLMVCNGFLHDLQDLDNINYLFGNNPFGSLENWKKQFVEKVKDIEGIFVNNYLFENNGDLTFSDKSSEWGFSEPSFSNGGVMSDLDCDGDLDIIINNLNGQPFIYENSLYSEDNKDDGSSNYLRIKFPENVLNANTIGTKISLYHKSTSQFYQHYLVRGYLSSIDPAVHFGLGKDTIINEIKIEWPDSTCKILYNVQANQTLVIEKGDEECGRQNLDAVDSKLFQNVTNQIELKYKHEEIGFEDFDIQPLLLHKYSQNGPGMAVGDVNGDQLEDIFIGSSRRMQSNILIQKADGSFNAIEIPGTEEFEDMGALLFDAEGDGDLDLYIVSGGAEHASESAYYLDRFYINDGNGNFKREKSAIPEITSSGSCVIGSDYDHDGDMDLFVGGRVTPGKFPITPKNYILKNDSRGAKIKFVDITENIAPGLKNVGMVTSGLWTDFNNDHLMDLVVVGEWMPITFFKNTGETFEKLGGETGLEYSSGCWNSIIGADFDKDGDIDYIAGNLGLNSWLKATQQEPLSLYSADFNHDGIVDPLIFNVVNGKQVPFHSRTLLISQMNYLGEKYPSYHEFANATLESMLDETQRVQAKKYFTYELRSSYIENLGDGKFDISPLPNIIQVAPVFGMSVDDFDLDGNFDVLVTGNSHATALRLGWYDASIGYFLKGNGNGNFTPYTGVGTGFFVDKDAKSMVRFKDSKNNALIAVASNNDSLMIFSTIKKYKNHIEVKESAAYVELYLRDKSIQKIEFYNGSGYLSSDGKTFFISSKVERLEVFDISGNVIEKISFE